MAKSAGPKREKSLEPSGKLPKLSSAPELRKHRDVAESIYVGAQGPAGVEAFAAACKQTAKVVKDALVKSGDLLALNSQVLAADRHLWQTLRFFCGPPISEENLWTFVGRKFNGALPTGLEAKMGEVLSSAFDPVRFPWVSRGVRPTSEQRNVAVVSTALVIAQAQFHTTGRGTASQKQEAAVHAVLQSAGYQFDKSAKAAEDLKPGTFCGEKTIWNKKCDVPVRLRDGRLLTLECKVSNTPKNSWKRLNQETVGKSNTWREHMGAGVVTGCVLSGVFDTACLVQAQDQGVFIFWEHDLAPLAAFVRSN